MGKQVKSKTILGSLTALLVAAATPLAAAAPTTDKLSQMFIWWNQAFKQPGAYTPENFGRYFTADATLTLNGETVIHGLDDWSKHFQAIQASGALVEIVVPFKDAFEKDGRLYTYHIIRSRRNGKVGCMLAAGHADLRGDKIAAITLVRVPVDTTKPSVDPQCWTS